MKATIYTLLFPVLASIACVFGSDARAQQSLYGLRLQDATGHILTLSAPPAGFTSSYSLRFPALGPGFGSLLYTSDSVGQTNWLAAGANGFVLSLINGLPAWVDPGSLDTAAGWDLSGNAITGAYNGTTGSFLGTINAQPLVIATTNTTSPQPIAFFSGDTERVRISASGNVGIGTVSPNTALDVQKDVAIRADTLMVSAGMNNNVDLDRSSNLRIHIMGTHGRDTISGLAGGYDGKIIRIFNACEQGEEVMTLLHESPNSSAANRIFTMDRKDLQIGDSGMVTLVYDAQMSRWVVTGAVGQLGGIAGAGLAFFGIKMQDDSITTDALADDPELQLLHVEAYQILGIEGMLYADAASNNEDFVVAFDVPNDYNYFKISVLATGDNGTNTVQGSDILDVDNTASAHIEINGGAPDLIRVSGIYVNGPSDGNIVLRRAKAHNSGSWMKLQKGSYLIGHKLR